MKPEKIVLEGHIRIGLEEAYPDFELGVYKAMGLIEIHTPLENDKLVRLFDTCPESDMVKEVFCHDLVISPNKYRITIERID